MSHTRLVTTPAFRTRPRLALLTQRSVSSRFESPAALQTNPQPFEPIFPSSFSLQPLANPPRLSVACALLQSYTDREGSRNDLEGRQQTLFRRRPVCCSAPARMPATAMSCSCAVRCHEAACDHGDNMRGDSLTEPDYTSRACKRAA